MKMIKKDKLLASLCDTDVNMSVIGAFKIVENAITEFMKELKIDGLTCMHEYNAMWVITRNRIEILQRLHWMDEYIVECYISAIGNVKLVIDTVIKKPNNQIVVGAHTYLCALDLVTGKIRSCNSVGVNENISIEHPEINIDFTSPSFVSAVLVDSTISRSMDIDYCQHTNNIVYIRHILNQYSTSQIKHNPIKAIEIQYVGQTFEGDKLDIYRCGQNNYSIRCNGTIVANCTIETKKAKIKRLT